MIEMFEIEFDYINYNIYFKCLWVGYVLGEVVKIIVFYFLSMFNWVIFCFGMNLCVNDWNNINVFDNGMKIIDIMFKELKKFDFLIMCLYLYLVCIVKIKFWK